MDVTDAASVAAADRAVADLGGVAIWVNNAGVFPNVPLLEMTEADCDGVFASTPAASSSAHGRPHGGCGPRARAASS